VGAQTLRHSVLMAFGSAKMCKAVERGDTAEVRRLVRSGADVEGPLHHVALRGHTETAKALLELGATVDGLDPHATPLHTAAANGRAGDILMLPQQALLPIFTPRRS
jgi:ankyrin repeat protein